MATAGVFMLCMMCLMICQTAKSQTQLEKQDAIRPRAPTRKNNPVRRGNKEISKLYGTITVNERPFFRTSLDVTLSIGKNLHLAIFTTDKSANLLLNGYSEDEKTQKLEPNVWNYVSVEKNKNELCLSVWEGCENCLPFKPQNGKRTIEVKSKHLESWKVCKNHCKSDPAKKPERGVAPIVILPMISCCLIIALVAINIYYNPTAKSRFSCFFKETLPAFNSWAPPPPPRINNQRGNQVNIINISSNNVSNRSEHEYEIIDDFRTDIWVNGLNSHRQSQSEASDVNGYIQPIPVRDSLRDPPRPLLPIIIRPGK